VANGYAVVCPRWWRCAGATLVGRLDVFGSAARTAEGAADLDLLVEFENMPAGAHADAYFGLLEDLEALLGRPVDLVMASAIRNPFLREWIERTARKPPLLYNPFSDSASLCPLTCTLTIHEPQYYLHRFQILPLPGDKLSSVPQVQFQELLPPHLQN
jgi:uncharacterized protein